jgi:ABC-2 type transport system permease protein
VNGASKAFLRTFWAILRRELLASFTTPLAPALFIVFLFVQGLHFAGIIDHFAQSPEVVTTETPLHAFFGNTVVLYFVLFLLIPPITMKQFAEERTRGTLELLLTTRIQTAAVVLGKFAAGLTLFAAMWLPTIFYLVLLHQATPLTWQIVASAYGGILIIGAACLAIGTLMSALMRSQFLALITTALGLLGLFVGGMAEFTAKEGSMAQEIGRHISIWSQMNDLVSGVVDSRRLVFDASLIFACLFLATRVLDDLRHREGAT